MSACPFCNASLDEAATECSCGAVKTSGLVQKLAGGIAFAVTLALLLAIMVLIAAIDPLAQRFLSDESMASTTQASIFASVVCVWILRSELRKPKWKRNSP